MKKKAEDIIQDDINTLKEGVSNKEVYEHIIASILEIYTYKLPYKQVLGQITKDIKNIEESYYDEVWSSIHSLTRAISGDDPMIGYLYTEEKEILNQAELKAKIAGDIYDFVQDNAQIKIL